MKKVIAIILVVVAVIGGTIFAITTIKREKKKEEQTAFSVWDNHGVVLKEDNETTFASGFTYSYKTNKPFALEMIPNTSLEEYDFNFTVNDANRRFFSELKLLNAFDVELEENGFNISVPSGTSIKTVFERIYPDSAINMPENVIHSSLPLFTLIISEQDGNGRIKLNFSLEALHIEMPTEIYF